MGGGQVVKGVLYWERGWAEICQKGECGLPGTNMGGRRNVCCAAGRERLISARARERAFVKLAVRCCYPPRREISKWRWREEIGDFEMSGVNE